MRTPHPSTQQGPFDQGSHRASQRNVDQDAHHDDKRRDSATHQMVERALEYKRVHGLAVATAFLSERKVAASLAYRVLTSPDQRRQQR
jgi:hypothetical protein